MKNKSEENSEYWPQFVSLITTETKYLDYFPDHGFITQVPSKEQVMIWLNQDYKAALKQLKPLMLPNQHKRLASKYANYKYNKKNQRSTFTINEVTIARLSKLLKLHGLDNYNELIEYLTQPDQSTQDILKAFANESPESGLTLHDSFKVFQKKLYAEQQNLIQSMLKDTYMQAWKDSKKSSTKSTEEMQNKMDEYLNWLNV
ncbi:hypothetical protein N7931_18760 [Catenovulum sp. 2E275]|uniref:hypothetical protein n=1 Tax=Catenovulum sp. 2E275 TaxID=2980497 RepID=UPI0021CE8CC1|nr:hypothetical protein [Catenovulum sp. 2E275]MCU4677660.1 hypothetical protein [Catenovulum sp. 2E275]